MKFPRKSAFALFASTAVMAGALQLAATSSALAVNLCPGTYSRVAAVSVNSNIPGRLDVYRRGASNDYCAMFSSGSYGYRGVALLRKDGLWVEKQVAWGSYAGPVMLNGANVTAYAVDKTCAGNVFWEKRWSNWQLTNAGNPTTALCGPPPPPQFPF